jgi:hypothetical protein
LGPFRERTAGKVERRNRLGEVGKVVEPIGSGLEGSDYAPRYKPERSEDEYLPVASDDDGSVSA